jgi:hypothetical protein
MVLLLARHHHRWEALTAVVILILGPSQAQNNNSPMVNCGEPTTISYTTPTSTCCTQANGMLVRDSTGQIRGCVIADYSQPSVANAFGTCCSTQMVLYDAVGKQAPDDATAHPSTMLTQ